MNFLTKPHVAKPSVIDHLLSTLGGYEPPRPMGKYLHASALTDVAFCPREVALNETTGTKPKGGYIAPALRVTFDVGNAVAELHRSVWLRQVVVGDWKCLCCQHIRRMEKWRDQCAYCLGEHFRYIEPMFIDPTIDVQGSVDILLDLGDGVLTLAELKIISPDEFRLLKAPVPDHRVRTNLYLHLVRHSHHPFKSSIDTSHAKILYTARNFGIKDDTRGKIHPFKEYDVLYDASAIASPVHMARLTKRWRDHGIMPLGLCDSQFNKRAQGCSACKACFSGQYPGVQ